MNDIDLSRLDLNLLVTFEVLMTERSVSRAAVRLARTQSAVSHSLARLRDQCLAAFQKHGRTRETFPLCVYTTVRIEQDAAAAEAHTSAFLERYYGGGVNFRGLMGLGPAAAVIDVMKRYQQAGVTDLCIRFAGEDQVAQLEQFIEGVLPALQ